MKIAMQTVPIYSTFDVLAKSCVLAMSALRNDPTSQLALKIACGLHEICERSLMLQQNIPS